MFETHQVSPTSTVSLIFGVAPLVRCTAKHLCEPRRVPWCVGLEVVVEVHVAVTAGFRLCTQELGPRFQIVLGVLPVVLSAMEALLNSLR